MDKHSPESLSDALYATKTEKVGYGMGKAVSRLIRLLSVNVLDYNYFIITVDFDFKL